MEYDNKIMESSADTYIEEYKNNQEEKLDVKMPDSENPSLYFKIESINDFEVFNNFAETESFITQEEVDLNELQIQEGHYRNNGPTNEFVLIEDKDIQENTKVYVDEDLDFYKESYGTMARGRGAHAEGDSTKAIGISAHAEGTASKAIGFASHAEGVATYARENGAHAEGNKTRATKDSAHSEGNRTKAEGFASHAEGFKTISNAIASHAEGYGTSTKDLNGAHIMGKFGDATHPYSWHLGNGLNEEYRGIAARIQGNGLGSIDLGWTIGNRGYAEMFETIDGEPIEPGYFVTLDGNKIRKANRFDDFVLGVTCANAGIIANSGELRWKNKYETDEWGRIQYRNILVPPVLNEDEYEILPEHYEIQPQLNLDWDSSQEYIPRLKRLEWVPVVLIGCVLVRDNGNCRVNGYCRANNVGYAVPSNRGYRVLERLGENQILILIK